MKTLGLIFPDQLFKNNPIFDYIQQSNDDINTAKTCEYGFSKK